jgi:hypothetical protein
VAQLLITNSISFGMEIIEVIHMIFKVIPIRTKKKKKLYGVISVSEITKKTNGFYGRYKTKAQATKVKEAYESKFGV